MKILVFSDLHAHPWPAFARPMKRGVNSRLLSINSVLRGIIAKAEEENCQAILFAGDLFHTPRIDVTTYDIIARTLRRVRIPFIMIPGNHDESESGAYYHSMRALVGKNRILLDFKEGNTKEIDGLKILGVPYCNDPIPWVRKAKGIDITLMHTGFAGAQAGFDYIAERKKFLQTKKLSKYDLGIVIAGHFHTPQIFYGNDNPIPCNGGARYNVKEGMILIPGAPLQHTFGDLGDRGYWIIEDKIARFHAIDAPIFVKLDPENEPHMTNKLFEQLIVGNYVSYTAHSIQEYDKVYPFLSEYAQGFTVRVKEDIKREDRRIDIRLDTPRLKILRRYVKANPMHIKRPKQLIKIGLKLMMKAEENG